MKYLVITQTDNSQAVCELITTDKELAKEYAHRNGRIEKSKKFYINATQNPSELLSKLGQNDGAPEIDVFHDLKAKVDVVISVEDGKVNVNLKPIQLSTDKVESYTKIDTLDSVIVIDAKLDYKSDEYLHLESVVAEMVTIGEEYLEAEFGTEDVIKAMKDALKL